MHMSPLKTASLIVFLILILISGSTRAEQNIQLQLQQTGPMISKDIFGQFVEHIGEGVYGGIWVGRNSAIPNVNGIRKDVTAALRKLQVPVVRWPGGCFADQYHWREGVGPQNTRTSRNNVWGNVVEPNSFGSDEFMEFIEQINSEAYLNVNVGTGSIQEAADWLEYLTAATSTSLSLLRAENGHPEPYKIKYIGFGNEVWGCGGAMSADEYFAKLKPFTTFVLNQNPIQRFSGIDLLFNRGANNPNAMVRIAAGPNDNDYEFTESLMKNWASAPGYLPVFDAISLHHYTMTRGPMSDSSLHFGISEYAEFIRLALEMDTILSSHIAIMDKYDPKKSISLIVDEWGNWLKPEISSNPMFLKQQNSLRDAITAGLTLNIFMRHADRVKMANIAQMVNVIQSMILTNDASMVLTPTYHLFKMYVPFQDSRLVPVTYETSTISIDGIEVPQLDIIAAKDEDGKVWLSIINLDPENSVDVEPNFGKHHFDSALGSVLTASSVNSVNSFSDPNNVIDKPVSYKSTNNNGLSLTLPPKSIMVVALSQ